MKINNMGQLFFGMALFALVSAAGSHSVAQETDTCQRNSKGDVICPSTGDSYATTPSLDDIGSGSIYNSGNPIFDTGSGSDFLSSLNNSILDITCGGSAFNLDTSDYLMNSIIIELSLASDISELNIESLLFNACEEDEEEVEGDDGGGEGSNPEALAGTCAERIGQAAENKQGYSTVDVAGTDGGNLACAWAVSTIMNDAGAGTTFSGSGGSTTLGTADLYNGLDADSCYEKVDTGYITSEDALSLQPGDILVTKTNSSQSKSDIPCRSSYEDRCNSGHTGVYIGNGEVVSNGGKGGNGGTKGISQNYTIDSWNGSVGGGSGTGVISRYPTGSAVFRNVCNDCGGGEAPDSGADEAGAVEDEATE